MRTQARRGRALCHAVEQGNHFLEVLPLAREPYEYLIVPGFLRPAALAAIHADYPKIDKPGSFPSDTLTYGPAFTAFLDELTGPDSTAAFSAKFGIDLSP